MPAEEKKKGFGSFSWQPKLWLLLIVLAFHGTTALSVGKNNNMQLPYQLYLFSLQASTEDDYSVPTRNVWKWKDTVLGDGRDFFVPRPKTLLALQRYLMQCVDKEENDGVEMDVTGCIEECIILSNCARLEIVFLTTLPAKAKADHQQAWLTTHLSRRLVAQTQSFGQDANHQLWNSLFPLDRPSNIDLSIQPKARDESRLLWTCLTTPDTICRHLCTVAAGMADRPSRPNRPVAFRPFSSRDAHILLQLKRTCTTFESDCPRLITLIQTALRAGKAARTVSKVPALEELRAYGTGDTSYDSAPPQSVMERVKEVCSICIHQRYDWCVRGTPSLRNFTSLPLI